MAEGGGMSSDTEVAVVDHDMTAGRRPVAQAVSPSRGTEPAAVSRRERAVALLRRVRGDIESPAAVVAREVSEALAPTLRSVVGYSNSRSRATIEATHTDRAGGTTAIRVEVHLETGQR
jgi:hypothetical protein